MLSVGYGGSIHDFAVVLADSKNILMGIEDERLSRIRYSAGELDPFQKGVEYISDALGLDLLDARHHQSANDTVDWAPLLKKQNVKYLSHHYAHAASVAYTSPFENAIVLVLDGAGSVTADLGKRHARETTSLYKLEGNNLTRLACISGEKNCPKHINTFRELTNNSLGDFYELLTLAAGFKVMQEGKTMALAAFGDDRFVPSLWAMFRLGPGFDFSVKSTGTGSVDEFLSQNVRSKYPSESCLPFEVSAALAYAAQCCIERVVEYLIQQAQLIHPSKYICISGGVALNSVLIGKLPDFSPFDAVHVISAPGDSGTAVGAALYPLTRTDRSSVRRWDWTPYLGRDYLIEIPSDLSKRAQHFQTSAGVADALAHHLSRGKIAAVFRGRSEFGPRALGNRSFLASANFDGVLTRLNRLKGREWFRPIAPITREPGRLALAVAESQMLAVRQIDPSTRLPRAAKHVDNTARVQFISAGAPEFLQELLCYAQGLGIQAVCNTSLNVKGQPLVETPSQAEALFREEDVDVLVLNNWVITKS